MYLIPDSVRLPYNQAQESRILYPWCFSKKELMKISTKDQGCTSAQGKYIFFLQLQVQLCPNEILSFVMENNEIRFQCRGGRMLLVCMYV